MFVFTLIMCKKRAKPSISARKNEGDFRVDNHTTGG